MQYRRLTAHLQTTNADFDRRLAAYLTNHVAMRTALGQAVSDSYAQNSQQYPGTPQFANQMQQQFQPNGFSSPSSMLPPQTVNRSPQMYRQSPYPTSHGQQSYRQNPQHIRSASAATPQELQQYTHTFSNQNSPIDNIKTEDRRMSLPVQNFSAASATPTQVTSRMTSPTNISPAVSRTSSTSNLANLKLEAARQGYPGARQTSPITKTEASQTPMGFPGQTQSFQPSGFPAAFNMPSSFDPSSASLNYNPFSTALPMESQQFLGGAFDPNDPMSSMLMGGENKPQQRFYSYNPNGASKKNFNAPSTYDGLDQTLAPGVLDTNVSQMGMSNSPSSAATDSVISPFIANGFTNGFDASYNDAFKPSSFMNNSHFSSGEITPAADGDWSNFVNGNMWEEPSSQTTIV